MRFISEKKFFDKKVIFGIRNIWFNFFFSISTSRIFSLTILPHADLKLLDRRRVYCLKREKIFTMREGLVIMIMIQAVKEGVVLQSTLRESISRGYPFFL